MIYIKLLNCISKGKYSYTVVLLLLVSVFTLLLVKQNNKYNEMNTEMVSEDYEISEINEIPGIFDNYLKLAEEKVNKMTLDEKIGQMLLVNYKNDTFLDAIKEYNIGGLIFPKIFFDNKEKEQVINDIRNLQKISKIPLLTSIYEEGGINVRASSNKKLIEVPFKSLKTIYKEKGLDGIKEDTIAKDKFLSSLLLNVNLSPVADVVTSEDAFMYSRSVGEDATKTGEVIKTIVETSKKSDVSNVLKHFPGYGNNKSVYLNKVTDEREYKEIEKQDLVPFKEGINAGAEAIMVGHIIYNNIDKLNPASLSKDVHKLLRNDLKFTGIVMTDDLNIKAVNNIENKYLKAVEAGNDILIVTDYKEAFEEIKKGLEDKKITKTEIDNIVKKIIAWKYKKGLLYKIK